MRKSRPQLIGRTCVFPDLIQAGPAMFSGEDGEASESTERNGHASGNWNTCGYRRTRAYCRHRHFEPGGGQESYPWCVFYDSSTYNCGFNSYAQCMATAQGGQGFCRPNPFADSRKRATPSLAVLAAAHRNSGDKDVLSVVIATHDSERPLLPTLAALVPGAAAGAVREVIIADAGSRDATAEIADVAGCHLLVSDRPRGARLKAAAATARSGWLLFLTPGVIPDVTWIDETRRFAENGEMLGLAHAAGGGLPRRRRAIAVAAGRSVWSAAPRRRSEAAAAAGSADRQAAL